jgi:hypothetical protein
VRFLWLNEVFHFGSHADKLQRMLLFLQEVTNCRKGLTKEHLSILTANVQCLSYILYIESDAVLLLITMYKKVSNKPEPATLGFEFVAHN